MLASNVAWFIACPERACDRLLILAHTGPGNWDGMPIVIRHHATVARLHSASTTANKYHRPSVFPEVTAILTSGLTESHAQIGSMFPQVLISWPDGIDMGRPNSGRVSRLLSDAPASLRTLTIGCVLR